MQNLIEQFRNEMARNGLRVTKNRLEIFSVLSRSQKPLSIQEIIAAPPLRSSHFTSVYRSIEKMAAAEILRITPRGFKNLYELGEKFLPHHHHITCERCGRSVAIEDARIEKLMLELAHRAGLVPTKHHFEIFGVCRCCQQ